MTLKLKQFNKSNNEVNSSIRREHYVIYSEIIEAVSIPRGGGTWVFFGWVCAARDSKLAPRSEKNFP